MAAGSVIRPPGILIAGGNWYHEGWIAGALGLPPREFDDPDAPVRDIDIDGYREGYATAIESGLATTWACRRMLESGQIRVEVRRRDD